MCPSFSLSLGLHCCGDDKIECSMVCEPINQRHFSDSDIKFFDVQLLSWFETDEKWLTKIFGQKAL